MSEIYTNILAYFVTHSLPAIYARIIGSNIAIFFTPMGALAGVMFLGILKNNSIKLSAIKVSLYGLIISVPTLFASLGGLYLSFLII